MLRGLLAAVLMALAVPTIVAAATPVMGAIEGKLTNGSESGSGVGDVQVTLFATKGDTSTAHLTTKTDAAGSFAFKDVNADPGNTYVVGLSYQDAGYFSDQLSFSDNETSKKINITVYDSTTDDAAITVVNAHTVIFTADDGLTIQELYVFANMSDRTYVGTIDAASGSRRTLRFSLPAGFTDLQLGGDLAGTGIMASDTGFVDTAPVPPGAKQAFYNYRVPSESSSYTYSRKIDYRTLKYSMLVQGDTVSVKSDSLANSGTTNMGSAVFTNAAGSDLAAGSELTARLSGLGAATKTPTLIWIGIGALVVLLGVLALYLTKRKKAAAPAVAGEDEEARLLSEMADLDEDFENGVIDEGPYRAARARIKGELIELEREKGAKAGGK